MAWLGPKFWKLHILGATHQDQLYGHQLTWLPAFPQDQPSSVQHLLLQQCDLLLAEYSLDYPSSSLGNSCSTRKGQRQTIPEVTQEPCQPYWATAGPEG